MTQKTVGRRIAINTISNYIGQIVVLAGGLLLTPFLIEHLGSSRYGLWVLVSAIVGYAGLLDLGIANAIVHYVAAFKAQGEPQRASALIATALWLYIGLGMLAMMLCVLLALLVPGHMHLNAAEQADLAQLMLISAVAVGVGIPCVASNAILRGLQRFDQANAIVVGGTLLSIGSMIAAVNLGWGLPGMIIANMLVNILSQIPSYLLIRRSAPDMPIDLRRAQRSLVREVGRFSWSLFLVNIASQLTSKTDELVISTRLPLAAITPYALGRRLSDVAQLLTYQFVKVLMPVASELHAGNEQQQLRELYVTSSRLALAAITSVGLVIILLADAILRLWVGPQFAVAAPIVLILTLSNVLDMSNWPAVQVLQGMGKHHPLSIISMMTAAANLGLSLLLLSQFGVIGVALGTCIPTVFEVFCFVLPYALRTLRVSVLTWLRSVLLPALIPALPTGLLLYLGHQISALSTLLELGLLGGLAGITYLVVYLLISPPERVIVRNVLRAYWVAHKRA